MIQWWSVENTGWSGGISWFSTGGTDANPLRFNSFRDALAYAERSKREFDQDTTYWRVVHTTLERTTDSETITRKWSTV